MQGLMARGAAKGKGGSEVARSDHRKATAIEPTERSLCSKAYRSPSWEPRARDARLRWRRRPLECADDRTGSRTTTRLEQSVTSHPSFPASPRSMYRVAAQSSPVAVRRRVVVEQGGERSSRRHGGEGQEHKVGEGVDYSSSPLTILIVWVALAARVRSK